MSEAQKSITLAKKFNVENMSYKPPRINKRGGKNIYIQYNGHNLYLQFSTMKTWGVNERVDEDTGRISYDLNLQFNSNDETTSEGALLKALKAIENKVLDDSSLNSKLWFGKQKMSREVAEHAMYPLLKYPKNKDTGDLDYSRPPTAKAKLPYWDGKFNMELYDMDKKPLFGPAVSDSSETPYTLVPSGSHLKGILECAGIWFVGGRYGVSWRLIQAQVRQPVRIRGFCLVSDSDDDDEEDEQQMSNLVMVDSEEEEDEPPPAPKPTKKKVVRRKKKKTVSS